MFVFLFYDIFIYYLFNLYWLDAVLSLLLNYQLTTYMSMHHYLHFTKTIVYLQIFPINLNAFYRAKKIA